MKFAAMAFAGAVFLSVACGASGSSSTQTCAYLLDGAAVAAFPANAFPSAWSDTKQEFRITLTDRTTGAVGDLIVPDCKRSEARRVIADRLAEDRSQATNGISIADRTYK